MYGTLMNRKTSTNVGMAGIARRLGISKALVSVALSGRQGTVGVSAENKRRILEIGRAHV